MILVWFIMLPLLGGVLAWYAGRRNAEACRWISAIALSLDLVLVLVVWYLYFDSAAAGPGAWIIDFNRQWIPQLGIGFHLALDGLSLLLVVLTLFLGLLSVISSWKEIQVRPGLFHLHLLWTLAGVLGVFLSLDLFLFYFFWELMIVPMYFLIAIWGHENRAYASVKFFIFTQLSSLLMFLAILALYFIHGSATGTYTFDYLQLLGHVNTSFIINLAYARLLHSLCGKTSCQCLFIPGCLMPIPRPRQPGVLSLQDSC